jgi:hypothetical protein
MPAQDMPATACDSLTVVAACNSLTACRLCRAAQQDSDPQEFAPEDCSVICNITDGQVFLVQVIMPVVLLLAELMPHTELSVAHGAHVANFMTRFEETFWHMGAHNRRPVNFTYHGPYGDLL